VAAPASFENVRQKWAPEITHFCPNAPIVLVGTKIDLRDTAETSLRLAPTRDKFVSYEQGLALAKDIGAARYQECSALTQKGLRIVFDEAVRLAMTPITKQQKGQKKKKAKCSLL